MKKGGKQGNSTQTGTQYEGKMDINSYIEGFENYNVQPNGYHNKNSFDVCYNNEKVALIFKKDAFYKYLESQGVSWKDIISTKLLPDSSLLVIVRKTLFIIEVKYQKVGGSTDEKLQTADFKRKQYTKLVEPLNLYVEYIYVLNDWFNAPKYKDVLEYIKSVGCRYFINELPPLDWFGLPKGIKK